MPRAKAGSSLARWSRTYDNGLDTTWSLYWRYHAGVRCSAGDRSVPSGGNSAGEASIPTM